MTYYIEFDDCIIQTDTIEKNNFLLHHTDNLNRLSFTVLNDYSNEFPIVISYASKSEIIPLGAKYESFLHMFSSVESQVIYIIDIQRVRQHNDFLTALNNIYLNNSYLIIRGKLEHKIHFINYYNNILINSSNKEIWLDP